MYLEMDTPLNLAHRHQRKAEALLKRENYEGAINHHKKAEELLSKALNETASPSAKESIQLQIEYHSRQQVNIKHRQTEAERRQQQTLEIKQSRESKTETLPEQNEKSATKELVQQTLKTWMEHDALLNSIFTDHSCSDDRSPSSLMSQSVGNIVKNGIKPPKDDSLRLEELRTNNEELKHVIFVMMSELEKSRAENEQLRMKYEELQKVHASCPPPSTNMRPLDITENSSSGFFSSDANIRNITSICDLPALAPIEMPKFDFYQE